MTLLVPRPYWDPDTEEAEVVVELAVPLLEQAAGRRVDAVIGDSDPLVAVRELLEGTAVDEVILSTLPERVSRWLRRDGARADCTRWALPVTVVDGRAVPRAASSGVAEQRGAPSRRAIQNVRAREQVGRHRDRSCRVRGPEHRSSPLRAASTAHTRRGNGQRERDAERRRTGVRADLLQMDLHAGRRRTRARAGLMPLRMHARRARVRAELMPIRMGVGGSDVLGLNVNVINDGGNGPSTWTGVTVSVGDAGPVPAHRDRGPRAAVLRGEGVLVA
jgi:hypothetical protein